jgi:hypothetical protein
LYWKFLPKKLSKKNKVMQIIKKLSLQKTPKTTKKSVRMNKWVQWSYRAQNQHTNVSFFSAKMNYLRMKFKK